MSCLALARRRHTQKRKGRNHPHSAAFFRCLLDRCSSALLWEKSYSICKTDRRQPAWLCDQNSASMGECGLESVLSHVHRMFTIGKGRGDAPGGVGESLCEKSYSICKPLAGKRRVCGQKIHRWARADWGVCYIKSGAGVQ